MVHPACESSRTKEAHCALAKGAVHRRRGLLVGHNLPFDLFRIAVAHEPARGPNPSLRGGFTVAVSRDKEAPRVQVKRTSPGAPSSA
ncbi:MAG: hypothetical protein JSS68_20695 [Actinobacteria bacterium]|nr:hypothetical protein [Actinomycetota bacterium]